MVLCCLHIDTNWKLLRGMMLVLSSLIASSRAAARGPIEESRCHDLLINALKDDPTSCKFVVDWWCSECSEMLEIFTRSQPVTDTYGILIINIR